MVVVASVLQGYVTCCISEGYVALAKNDDSDVVRFGKLVREKRVALGWSQEALASTAFNNPDRKGYVSLIENGQIPNIERATVQNVARALNIDIEEIPRALRWPEAIVEGKDTEPMLHTSKDGRVTFQSISGSQDSNWVDNKSRRY
ncbi:MAG: hypothetical protein COB90_05240 [Hyphomicrobiales bacterium]|nr:MAG: hypothetical protein COB90_05240 [Hyphomicrobiales bacterium]